MDRFIERLLLASRWLMVPLFLGLAVLLLLFVVDFFIELGGLAAAIIGQQHPHLTLKALTLLDLVLVASLILMVMLNGFENYVGRIRLGDEHQRLSWLTELGSGSIKVKIMSAISVISGIYLLEQFFDIDQTAPGKLLWMVILHLTFVATAVLLALLDRMAEH